MGGLKNKIEIQWSYIVAIKANFPDDGPETWNVVRDKSTHLGSILCGRPTSDFTEEDKHSIHSIFYIASKASWESIFEKAYSIAKGLILKFEDKTTVFPLREAGQTIWSSFIFP
ncbi:hypothetical protein NC651_014689 [Populus alba x Populus x berolinensis]|nr:hypothetical protein NC651_014689 [Populus alba x Populus x berolinensis]